MHLHWTEYVLWFTCPALQALIAYFMVKKRYSGEYPAFFAYTVYQASSAFILFGIWRYAGYGTYYYAYWAVSALGVLLSFLVMHEIFVDAFRPYEALRDLGAMLFRWSGLILLMLAGLSAFVSRQTDVSIMYDSLMAVQRSVLVMQCGLVLFLILFSRYLGISSRHYLFGIAFGFGVNASLDLMVCTARSYFGFTAVTTMRVLSSSGYLLSVAIWLTYTLVKAAERRKTELVPQSERWNQALAVALDLPPSEGFLCDMERTVDRLLHQRNNGVGPAITESISKSA
jgi:hypothetical protein